MAEYFFELLAEEIPAWMHDAAQAALQQQLARLLEEVGAPGAQVSVTSTPRRFILFLPNVPLRESDREEEIEGPPRRAAYDALGRRPACLHPTHPLRAVDVRGATSADGNLRHRLRNHDVGTSHARAAADRSD